MDLTYFHDKYYSDMDCKKLHPITDSICGIWDSTNLYCKKGISKDGICVLENNFPNSLLIIISIIFFVIAVYFLTKELKKNRSRI